MNEKECVSQMNEKKLETLKNIIISGGVINHI